MFSQPTRMVPPKHSGNAEKNSGDISRKGTDNSRPPRIKSAWSNQPKREKPKKDASIGKETKTIKSNRQRSYSEVENIEILYPVAQTRDKTKHEDKKANSGLSKSKSEDRLDSQDAQSTEHILTGRSASSAISDTSATPCKFSSREATVKSQKPTTKPLHLGRLDAFMTFLNTARFLRLIILYFLLVTIRYYYCQMDRW